MNRMPRIKSKKFVLFGLFARHLPRELRGVRGAGQGDIRD